MRGTGMLVFLARKSTVRASASRTQGPDFSTNPGVTKDTLPYEGRHGLSSLAIPRTRKQRIGVFLKERELSFSFKGPKSKPDEPKRPIVAEGRIGHQSAPKRLSVRRSGIQA